MGLSRLISSDQATFETFTEPSFFDHCAEGRGTAGDGFDSPAGFAVEGYPATPKVVSLFPRFVRNLHTHPLFAHYRAAGPFPRKVSDVASLSEFRSTLVYQEFHQPIGVCREMLFFLGREKCRRVGVSLRRAGSDFSESDRRKLVFLSPHLDRAYQNARERDYATSVLEGIGEGLSSLERALILVGNDHGVRWMSPLAREWVEGYLPAWKNLPGGLPPEVRDVIRQMQARPARGLDRFSFVELRTDGGRGYQFHLRCGRAGEHGFIIKLIRERDGFDPVVVSHFGLTKREAEIWFWISEGKGNKEIGRILNISPRTIHKHVEHVLAKLGTQNRFGAQRLGCELRRG